MGSLTRRMGLTARDVLLWAARRVRGDLALGALSSSTHQACEAAVPVLIGVIIDRGVATGDVDATAGCIAVLVGVFVVLATAVLGGVWGLVYLLRRSIVAPMVSHAGFNLEQLVKYAALG